MIRNVPRDEILLVEDNDLAREALAELLREAGFRVSAARTSQEAILHAERGGVGVVIMDIILDGSELDGIETAVRLQAAHPYVSFLFVTAYAADKLFLRRATEADLRIGGWFLKPIDDVEVVAAVRREHEFLDWLVRLDMAQADGFDRRSFLEGATAADTSELPSPEGLRRLRAEVSQWSRVVALDDEALAQSRSQAAHLEKKIEGVYAEMKKVVAEVSSGQAEKLRDLREELVRLQLQEVEILDRVYGSSFKFDADRAEELFSAVEGLLKKVGEV